MGSIERYAGDFLEHLNFSLGPKNSKGYTLVAVDPGRINLNKLKIAIDMAGREEYNWLRQKQGNPNARRMLIGWEYHEGLPPIPTNRAVYGQAVEIAEALSDTDRAKLIGGYGGKRGKKPTGDEAIALAADTLYNASHGIDVLTGGPLDYKQNAGHIFDFNKYGQGPTRPEPKRPNVTLGDKEGLDKLLQVEKSLDEIRAVELLRDDPEAMEGLLAELPSSPREKKGWQPELNAIRGNSKRWHVT